MKESVLGPQGQKSCLSSAGCNGVHTPVLLAHLEMWGQGKKVLQVQRGCLGRAACYTRVSLASSANFLPYLLVKEGSLSPGEEGKFWAELSIYPSSKWYPAHLMLLEGILFNSRGRKAFLVCLLLLDQKSGNARYGDLPLLGEKTENALALCCSSRHMNLAPKRAYCLSL